MGEEAVKRMIDDAMVGSSVTAVLIGAETAERPYVKYEIDKSLAEKGLVSIYINSIKNLNGHTDTAGANPFDRLYVERNGWRVYLSSLYKTYRWLGDDGYRNFGAWVEEAARAA